MPSDTGGGQEPTPPTKTRPFDSFGALLVLLLAGLALRVLVAAVVLPQSGFSNDISAFSAWALRLADVGPGGFYIPDYLADYPPGYMYILWLLGEVSRWLEPVLGANPIRGLVKVPGIAADLGAAWLIYVIARRFLGTHPPSRWLGFGERIGLIGAAVYLFNPGTVFNSAVWGQIDAVGALVILCGLYALGRGWTEAAGLAAIVAVLVKFQFGWLIPIVLVVGLKRHLFGRSSVPELAARPDPVRILTSLAVSFGSLVVLILPFGMTVWPTGDPNTGLFDKLRAAADTYQGLSINAFNIWRNPWSGLGDTSWWGDDRMIAFALGGLEVTWAMVGVALFAVGATAALVAVARRDDMLGLLTGSLTMAVAFFALPTRVHERYLFPAVALAALLVGVAARWAAAYVAIAALFFLNVYWVYSADWSHALPTIINPGLGGQPFGRDPLLAATVFTDWGIYLLSMSSALLLGWITWQAVRPAGQPEPGRSDLEEGIKSALSVGASVRSVLGGPQWLRQDPVPEAEREPPRRLDRLDLALVVGLVVLALVLRLWRLDEPRSMHFDEVYHVRTATEYLADQRWGWTRDPYEWTHPMLAKYLIAAGIEVANPNQVTGTTALDGPLTALAVAPQRTAFGWPSSIVFTTDGGREIQARDASTGQRVSAWEADGPVASLAWDSDSTRLLAGLTSTGTIRAWDVSAFMAAQGERAPPPGVAGIETGMDGVEELLLPLDESVLVVRGPEAVVVLERVTGAELGRRDLAVSAVAYVSAVSGDEPVGARVIVIDDQRESVLSLDATTLRTESTQQPPAPPVGPLLTRGRGSNQEVWMPVGPLEANDEHPATTGGLTIFKGGTLNPIDTVPLPGPARAIAWDHVANLVYVAGPASVWTIEPHGDGRSGYAVYDETPVGRPPVAMALDVSDHSQTDDHARLIVATAGSEATLVSIDVRGNGFAWRLAGVAFGAVLAGLVYLLTAMLFRRRSIAILAAVFVAIDLMSFAMSRIGMNDIFVATFIVAGYALFWPIWGARWQRSAWWVLPLVGVMIGLAAASKWVGWYALLGLWFLVLARSQLGRFLLVAAAGFGAVAVGIGAPWPFTLIAVAILALALALAWVRPVRLSGGELTALAATGLVVGGIGLAFAIAFPTIAEAREPHGIVELGFGLLFRGIQAGWPAAVALVVAGVLLVARAIRSVARPHTDGRWFAPAEMAGFAWPWVFACLVIIPLAVYVATYVPWLNLGHSFAIPNTGPGYAWSLDELHAQMFGYHYGLQASHAASSPWWSWPLDLKPVWFYSHSFDLNRIAVIYNGGNPVLFWASVPAVLASLFLAWRRRSWALLLLAVAFGFQYLPWVRIERATFQYHYLTAVLFAFVAVAYLLDEVLRDRSLRDYGVAFLVAVGVTGLLIYPLNSALAMPDWYVNAARALPPWNYAFQFPAPPQGERPPLISTDPILLAVATTVSVGAAAFASFGRDLLEGRLPARLARSGRAAQGGGQDQDAGHDQGDGPDKVEVQPG